MLTYCELKRIQNWGERCEYLKLNGSVGKDTFGFDRYLNQMFYRSAEWKRVRREIILRDNGADLGVAGYDIPGKIFVHHMNPLKVEDIVNSTDYLLNPEFLICCSKDTHDYIHYGVKREMPVVALERTRYDTCPWRRLNE